jgi:hypothetical protein
MYRLLIDRKKEGYIDIISMDDSSISIESGQKDRVLADLALY